MKRIPIITDTHYGCRGDSQVVYANQEEFYRQVFWPAIDAEGGVTDLLHLGDVTDRRRYINFQTLSFAKHMLFEPARQRGIRIHWLLGNHDLPYKHSLILSSYEAFREYANVEVYTSPRVIRIEGVDVLMVPWVCDETHTQTIRALESFQGSVVMGHLELAGFELSRGIIADHGMSAVPFKRFDLVLTGHYHHRSAQGPIHYLGAPYEMNWGDYGDPHGFTWWTPATHALTFVENPYHLFYVFEYDDADQPASYVSTLVETIASHGVKQRIVKVHVRRKTQLLWYESFVDAVLKLGCHDVQFVDDTAWARDEQMAQEEAADVSMDTLSTIRWYVRSLPWANTEVQQAVTDQMVTLYQEATDHAKTLARG